MELEEGVMDQILVKQSLVPVHMKTKFKLAGY